MQNYLFKVARDKSKYHNGLSKAITMFYRPKI